MPDRYALTLRTALASNTGGPYTATWDRVVVTTPGTIRAVVATARSIASNARQNTVDVFLQPDAPSAGSNTAATVLVSPITLSNDNAAASGSIRDATKRVAAGDQLQLRTDMGTTASQPGFLDLTASVEVERD